MGGVVHHAGVVEELEGGVVVGDHHVFLGVGARDAVDVHVLLPLPPDPHHAEPHGARPGVPLGIPLVDRELVAVGWVEVEDLPAVAVRLDDGLAPQLRGVEQRQAPVQVSDGGAVPGAPTQMLVATLVSNFLVQRLVPPEIVELRVLRNAPTSHLAAAVRPHARVVDVDGHVVGPCRQVLIVRRVLQLVDGGVAVLEVLQGLQGFSVHDFDAPVLPPDGQVLAALGVRHLFAEHAEVGRAQHGALLSAPDEDPGRDAAGGVLVRVVRVRADAVEVGHVAVHQDPGALINLPDVALVGARDELLAARERVQPAEHARLLFRVDRLELQGPALDLLEAYRSAPEPRRGAPLPPPTFCCAPTAVIHGWSSTVCCTSHWWMAPSAPADTSVRPSSRTLIARTPPKEYEPSGRRYWGAGLCALTTRTSCGA